MFPKVSIIHDKGGQGTRYQSYLIVNDLCILALYDMSPAVGKNLCPKIKSILPHSLQPRMM